MGVNFKDWDGFKNFSTGRVPVYLRGQYLTTYHELLQKSVKNFVQNFRYGSFKESSLRLSFSNFF